MPPHPATLDDAALLRNCQVRRGRTSGPGGQHRNKVETAIELTHQPTGIIATATERRSQQANKRAAMFRLRLKLATTVRTAWTERAPSELWQSRRAGGKLAVNATHADFPALLAEALDVIDAMEGDVAQAAKCLGISTSQLVKLVGKHKPALSMVNQQRASRGLAKLR